MKQTCFCLRRKQVGRIEARRSEHHEAWRLPWGSCHARREHLMNMYRQAVAAPCNLRLAGNYLRENGPGPARSPRARAGTNRWLRASGDAAARLLLTLRRPARTRRGTAPIARMVIRSSAAGHSCVGDRTWSWQRLKATCAKTQAMLYHNYYWTYRTRATPGESMSNCNT